eukprot:746796-Hanusia_phi.AAC.3
MAAQVTIKSQRQQIQELIAAQVVETSVASRNRIKLSSPACNMYCLSFALHVLHSLMTQQTSSHGDNAWILSEFHAACRSQLLTGANDRSIHSAGSDDDDSWSCLVLWRPCTGCLDRASSSCSRSEILISTGTKRAVHSDAELFYHVHRQFPLVLVWVFLVLHCGNFTLQGGKRVSPQLIVRATPSTATPPTSG